MSVEVQANAIRKWSRKLRRLRKELGQRTEGGQNWKKTKRNLERTKLRLNSALEFYHREGGTDQDLIAEAKALLRE